jgi:hypothetical protein
MPLNGSGTASKPSGTTAVSNTTIESSKFNSVIDDIYSIFNTARPIAYGGTGASTAVGGYDGLTTKGSDVASAATLNLNNATGAFVDITGTTTVTAVTLSEGKHRMARAVSAFQLTASASLVVNGSTSVNYTTTAGDLLFFEGYSSSVVRVWITPQYLAGTWTPGISFDAATGIAYSAQSGTYTKIGRLLYASGRITLSSKGSSTGTARITGFPFGVIGSIQIQSGLVGNYSNMSSITGCISFLANPSATSVTLYMHGASNSTPLNDTNFTNTSDLRFSIVFEVA